MYVARYTYDPMYDAERRWVGWIGVNSKTQRGCALLALDHCEHPRYVTILGERVQWDDLTEDEMIDWAVENLDIRLHEPSGLWMLVHHSDGLSCWRLDAETIEDAIEEARAMDADGAIDWCGFGDVTRGAVKWVGSVSDTLHIFECDDVQREDW